MTTRDDLFGSGTFDDDPLGTDASLDLDDAVERTAQGARSLPARPPADDRPWPTGVSPDSAAIDVDPAEIALIASYGAVPSGKLGAVPYAVQVLRRQRVLRPKIRELNDALLGAERTRDEHLASMIAELRAELSKSADGRRILEPVTRIEALAGERRNAMTGVSEAYGAEVARVGQEEAALAVERDDNTRTVEKARGVLAERQLAHDRAEARKKRLYIEVRGVLDAVESAGGTATAEQASRIEVFEADVKKHAPGLEAARVGMEEARAAVVSAESAGREIARRLRDAARRKSALSAESRKQVGAHSHGVDEAEAHRLQAVGEAARALLAARGRIIDVPRPSLDALLADDDAVERRARELERHVRALDAYDRGMMTSGLAIAAGVAVTLLLVLVALMTR